MPSDEPPRAMIAVLIPTTLPSMSNSGPPELPWLIAASVWMKSSYGPYWMSRLRAETIPSVTEPPSPNGLPIAITQSPTCAVVAVAELHERQRVAGIDLEHGEVGLVVRAHELRRQPRAICQHDERSRRRRR